jgi:dihydroorotate dehydrogenase
MGLVVGGNIGKNKVTPNEDAWKDYVICFNELFDHVDYFVVNVSSPNTPGLRELQEKGPLLKILNKLQEINQSKTSPKPLLLKIAPDLSKDQLNDVIEVAVETNLTGLIISNTTINRDNLKTDRETVLDLGAGGISGKPVFEHSNAMLTTAYHKINGRFKLIGVGGVFDVNDYEKKLECGADLVQVYTGFIYSGPSTAKNILNS